MHSNKQFPLCHLYDQNKTFAVTEFSMPISNDDIIKFKKLHNLKCCFCIDHEDTGNSKLKINKLKTYIICFIDTVCNAKENLS